MGYGDFLSPKGLKFFLYLISSRRGGFGRTTEGPGLAGRGPWLTENGGKSELGVGQVVLRCAVSDDVGHGSEVDAGDELADVFVANG
jgi:hypothetical protein